MDTDRPPSPVYTVSTPPRDPTVPPPACITIPISVWEKMRDDLQRATDRRFLLEQEVEVLRSASLELEAAAKNHYMLQNYRNLVQVHSGVMRALRRVEELGGPPAPIQTVVPHVPVGFESPGSGSDASSNSDPDS